MIFIVTGDQESGIMSTTCDTAAAALQTARRFLDEGARGVLIDAGGREYAPADFDRLFVAPSTSSLVSDQE